MVDTALLDKQPVEDLHVSIKKIQYFPPTVIRLETENIQGGVGPDIETNGGSITAS